MKKNVNLQIQGNRNSSLEISIPKNFSEVSSDLPADQVIGLATSLAIDRSINLQVKVSSGAWSGSEIEVYIDHKYLSHFLKDLKVLILNPGASARIQPDKTGSPRDIETLEASFLFLHVASTTMSNEVWVYGHIQQTDYRAKLSFSFEVEHEKLKALLEPLQELGF